MKKRSLWQVAASGCLFFAAMMLSCGGEPEVPPAPTALEVLGKADNPNPQACPEVKILCPEGKVAKQLPSCRWVCVPDQQWECDSNDDCVIYCFAYPCPEGVCSGHKCTVRDGGGQGGEPCGDLFCGASSYCCNESCGICAPIGGACIQLACN